MEYTNRENTNRQIQVGKCNSNHRERSYESEIPIEQIRIENINRQLNVEKDKSEIQVGTYHREGTNRKNDQTITNRSNLPHCNIANTHVGGGEVLGAFPV